MFYRNEEVSTLDGVLPPKDKRSLREVLGLGNNRKAFSLSPVKGTGAVYKRVFDIVFSLVAILLLTPVLLLISLLVKTTSSGPIIFKQRRHGLSGEEIDVWKFRTMVQMENGRVVTQAKRNDDRVTSIGRFLRKTSLDELPQFFNVLQGTMSVIGPRPHAVAHNKFYRGKIKNYMRRHVVKPGITGLAQVNGARGATETIEKMERRVRLDLEYIRNWSPWLDVHIVILTAFRGFSDDNAF
ncbi:MAG: exopolysaccharide biosynthesis polyprenyl glycosylphosphotransferase [Acidiferrobacterales bacterium]|nr:exopolysaccharide biosynthesis polyprenyl glycosylphosphotransferase [Acidiferrobacterales bacterium]